MRRLPRVTLQMREKLNRCGIFPWSCVVCPLKNSDNLQDYSKFVLRGWHQWQHESCIQYLGGFSTGDMFEFGSVGFLVSINFKNHTHSLTHRFSITHTLSNVQVLEYYVLMIY